MWINFLPDDPDDEFFSIRKVALKEYGASNTFCSLRMSNLRWSLCNLYHYPRRAWAATGIVVRWSVCLFVMCESTHLQCHGTAFTAWIAFIQQVINFNSGRISC